MARRKSPELLQLAQQFQEPEALPPLRESFSTDDDHMAALIDYKWRSDAYMAVHGLDPQDAERMREAVFAELHAGKPLHPSAIDWLQYVTAGKLRRAKGGGHFTREEQDAQDTRVARWFIDNNINPDQPLTLDTELAAAEALHMHESTVRRVFHRETFKINLATLRFALTQLAKRVTLDK